MSSTNLRSVESPQEQPAWRAAIASSARARRSMIAARNARAWRNAGLKCCAEESPVRSTRGLAVRKWNELAGTRSEEKGDWVAMITSRERHACPWTISLHLFFFSLRVLRLEVSAGHHANR
jgi:hypothetical protein